MRSFCGSPSHLLAEDICRLLSYQLSESEPSMVIFNLNIYQFTYFIHIMKNKPPRLGGIKTFKQTAIQQQNQAKNKQKKSSDSPSFSSLIFPNTIQPNLHSHTIMEVDQQAPSSYQESRIFSESEVMSIDMQLQKQREGNRKDMFSESGNHLIAPTISLKSPPISPILKDTTKTETSTDKKNNSQMSFLKVKRVESINEDAEEPGKQQHSKKQSSKIDPLAMLFGGKPEKKKQKKHLQEQKIKSRSAQNALVNWLASENKSFQTLKQKLKNQKHLKLKDYMRLTSLSNQSRYKKTKKLHEKEGKVLSSIKSSMRSSPKKGSAIDPKISINLIKNSISKKIRNTFEDTSDLMKEVENKQIVGEHYDDLVFMCNLHQIFDENVFQSAKIINQLFIEYKNKKHLHSIEDNEKFISQILKNILANNRGSSSPKKKKKISSPQNLAYKLTSMLLTGSK